MGHWIDPHLFAVVVRFWEGEMLELIARSADCIFFACSANFSHLFCRAKISLICCALELGVIVGAVIEELWIDFHEQFHCIVYHSVDGPMKNISITAAWNCQGN